MGVYTQFCFEFQEAVLVRLDSSINEAAHIIFGCFGFLGYPYTTCLGYHAYIQIIISAYLALQYIIMEKVH